MTTWIVDDNNDGDFSTIADAIAGAAKGDKIIVISNHFKYAIHYS